MAHDREAERPLPANMDAERTILGAILLDNEIFFDDIADLSVEDFALEAHRRTFACINEILFGMIEGVTKVDIVTLAELLYKRKHLEQVGGVAWLALLTEGLPRRLSCTEYVRIVKDKAKLRSIINICSTAITRCADQSEEAVVIRADLQDKLIGEDAEGDGKAVHIAEVIGSVEEAIERDRTMSEKRTALELSWGISGLDDFTKGAFKGELTVAAGESGGGKTAFATQMTLINAREGVPVGWFSMEMTKKQLVRRFYPQMGNIITANHMRDPRLMNLHTHMPELKRLSDELRKLPIHIDDQTPLTINQMIARVRMMRRKLGIRLFVGDYFQLIVPRQARTETEGYKANAYALRELEKLEPDIHFLCLSQYSKAQGFQKKNKRTRGDLYGSSAIHQAAQNVLIITIENPEDKQDNDLLEVDINVDKQREGKKGKIKCMFDRDHLTYTYAQPNL
jgi:replicative DNA helicase